MVSRTTVRFLLKLRTVGSELFARNHTVEVAGGGVGVHPRVGRRNLIQARMQMPMVSIAAKKSSQTASVPRATTAQPTPMPAPMAITTQPTPTTATECKSPMVALSRKDIELRGPKGGTRARRLFGSGVRAGARFVRTAVSK